MAMIECKECKTQISDQAAVCPKCGAKNVAQRRKTSAGTWFVGGLAAIIAVSCITSMESSKVERDRIADKKNAAEAAKSPAQKASEAAAVKHDAQEFTFAVTAAKAVKASRKDPTSFELVSAGVVDGGALCMTYRARNAFNAIVTEQVAIRRTYEIGQWNKDCAKHNVVSMNYIKQEL